MLILGKIDIGDKRFHLAENDTTTNRWMSCTDYIEHMLDYILKGVIAVFIKTLLVYCLECSLQNYLNHFAALSYIYIYICFVSPSPFCVSTQIYQKNIRCVISERDALASGEEKKEHRDNGKRNEKCVWEERIYKK